MHTCAHTIFTPCHPVSLSHTPACQQKATRVQGISLSPTVFLWLDISHVPPVLSSTFISTLLIAVVKEYKLYFMFCIVFHFKFVEMYLHVMSHEDVT